MKWNQLFKIYITSLQFSALNFQTMNNWISVGKLLNCVSAVHASNKTGVVAPIFDWHDKSDDCPGVDMWVDAGRRRLFFFVGAISSALRRHNSRTLQLQIQEQIHESALQ